jgi:hypothetical protein
MDWPRLLAYITGTVDQELLLRNEYLVAENRFLKAQIKARLRLSDAERITLAEIGHRLGGQAGKRQNRVTVSNDEQSSVHHMAVCFRARLPRKQLDHGKRTDGRINRSNSADCVASRTDLSDIERAANTTFRCANPATVSRFLRGHKTFQLAENQR